MSGSGLGELPEEPKAIFEQKSKMVANEFKLIRYVRPAIHTPYTYPSHHPFPSRNLLRCIVASA